MAETDDRKVPDEGVRNKEDRSGQALQPEGGLFEIHVKGQLDSRWSDWLDGMEVSLLGNGEMILFGPVADQAALMGILNKIARLNLTLLSVNEVIKKGIRKNEYNTDRDP